MPVMPKPMDLVPSKGKMAGAVATTGALDNAERDIIAHLRHAQMSTADALKIVLDVYYKKLWQDRVYADGTQVHRTFTEWSAHFCEEIHSNHGIALSSSTLNNTLWMVKSLMDSGYSTEQALGVPLRTFYALRKVVDMPTSRNQLPGPTLRNGASYDPDEEGLTPEEQAERIVREVVENTRGGDTNGWLLSLRAGGDTIAWTKVLFGGEEYLMVTGEGPTIPDGFRMERVCKWNAVPEWALSDLIEKLGMPSQYSRETALDLDSA